jgi:hypothetical protein
MTDTLIDPPGAWAPLETWEAFLRELEGLPADRPLRAQLIRRAKRIIATIRQIEEHDQNRLIVALIDPPGPFSSVASWQRFLESMELAPPNLMFRDDLIRKSKATIAELTAQGDPYAEGEKRAHWLWRARSAAAQCPERPAKTGDAGKSPMTPSSLARLLDIPAPKDGTGRLH